MRCAGWVLAFGLLSQFPVTGQQSMTFTMRPFVQPNGVIDLNLASNWQQGPRFGALNTQFQTLPGVPFTVGQSSHQLRTFSRQNVPYLRRLPFLGSTFRTQSRFQQTGHSRFTFRATPVDPAGNPVYRPGGQRVPIPKMYGLIPPKPPGP